MQRLKWVCLALIVLWGVTNNCAWAAYEKENQNCVKEYNPQKDYFPEKIELIYAKRFVVEYHKNYKLLTLNKPWYNADISFQYLLVQCGTPIPKGYPKAEVIEIPIKKIIPMSTTYLPSLDKLNLVQHIVALPTFQYVNTPSVQERIQQKRVVEVGHTANLNIEKVIEIDPDLVMTFGMGDPKMDAQTKQLSNLGVNVVINAEYMETSPLGGAEWIKFMSLFFNREAEATQEFQQIDKGYQKLLKLTEKISTKKRPTVFARVDYQGTWYAPGGKSFAAILLKDAGAHYLWEKNKSVGSLHLDFEVVLEKAQDAQFWVNTTTWSSIDEALAANPRYAHFQALQYGRVFNNNARVNEYGGSDYYETALANPHLLLADLIKIFHPQLLPKHQFIWYRPLDPPTKK